MSGKMIDVIVSPWSAAIARCAKELGEKVIYESLMTRGIIIQGVREEDYQALCDLLQEKSDEGGVTLRFTKA